MSREAMQMALEALELYQSKSSVQMFDDAVKALSQARSLTDELMDCVDRLGSEADTVDPRVWQHLLVYAPKPEEEPVAWMYVNEDGECEQIEYGPVFDDPGVTPLYTVPKQWVGLTAYEIQEIHSGNQHWGNFACAIEQALKEKNHG